MLYIYISIYIHTRIFFRPGRCKKVVFSPGFLPNIAYYVTKYPGWGMANGNGTELHPRSIMRSEEVCHYEKHNWTVPVRFET